MSNAKYHPYVPMVIDPYEGLAPWKDVNPTGADSWFLVAHMKNAAGHEYTFLIHTLNRGVGDNRATVCISDLTDKTYISEIVNQCEIIGSDNGVSFCNDVMRWSIQEQSMKVSASIKGGRYGIELTVKGDGTVMGYNGNGVDPVFGKELQNIQYAFPVLDICGTLTIDGETQQLTGDGWFDRQWGPLPFGELLKGNANWLWIAGSLDNGYSFATGGTILNDTTFDWITALSPEGSYVVAPIENSVLDSKSDPWVSEESGKEWYSHWTAHIPSLDADLDIRMSHLGQEVFCATDRMSIPSIEAVVNITGTFQGKPVTGKGFIEIVS